MGALQCEEAPVPRPKSIHHLKHGLGKRPRSTIIINPFTQEPGKYTQQAQAPHQEALVLHAGVALAVQAQVDVALQRRQEGNLGTQGG